MRMDNSEGLMTTHSSKVHVFGAITRQCRFAHLYNLTARTGDRFRKWRTNSKSPALALAKIGAEQDVRGMDDRHGFRGNAFQLDGTQDSPMPFLRAFGFADRRAMPFMPRGASRY